MRTSRGLTRVVTHALLGSVATRMVVKGTRQYRPRRRKMSSVIMIGLATCDYYIRRPFEISLSINKGKLRYPDFYLYLHQATVCRAHARPRAALAAAIEQMGSEWWTWRGCGTNLNYIRRGRGLTFAKLAECQYVMEALGDLPLRVAAASRDGAHAR